jgi:ABC-type Fe3+ transport system substrate-binding protein
MVAGVGEFETYHMQKLGLMMPYKSPHAAAYPEGFKDPNGYWTDFYDNLIVSAYNTTRVKRDEVPKRWEDLLQPRWKKRMVTDRNEDRWFANMLHVMGEKKGMELLERRRSGKALTAAQQKMVDNAITPFDHIFECQEKFGHIAVLRGCDVDKPRNLAKSVTVE